jgi:methyl-accepting chemotaxis protein
MGALAGGAISLLDKETRKSVADSCRKCTKEVTYMISHPNELAEQVKSKTNQIRSTVEQVSEDVSFIAEKVEELREVTPTVVGIVNDTKEAFTNDEEDKERY